MASAIHGAVFSSNAALVPDASVHLPLGGAAGARTQTITPAPDQHDTATISIRVFDGTTPALTSFTLTVAPVADPPSISAITDQTLVQDESSAPLAFTIAGRFREHVVYTRRVRETARFTLISADRSPRIDLPPA